MRLAAIVGLIAFAVYMGSFRTIQSIDSNTNALLAYTFVQDRDPYLDEFKGDRRRLSYWDFTVDGHEIAPYPPGAALLAVPIVALGASLGIAPPQAAAVTIVAKAAGALAAALSVATVLLLAARVADRRIALVVASLYAFGTVTWAISGGALWQHGAAQLFLALGLLWLYPSSDDRRAVRSGLAFGLATLCRLTDAAFALAALYEVARARRQVLGRFVLWAAPPALALFAYNAITFGAPIDLRYLTYNVSRTGETSNFALGFVGNLAAPNRGLFVYSPFLLFAAYELVRRALGRDDVARFLRGQLIAAVAVLAVYAATIDWWGGYGYGNRYLADALPLFALGLALWLRRVAHTVAARIALAVTAAWSIGVFALGALVYDWQRWSWESRPDLSQQQLQWSVDPPQIWYTLANAPSRIDSLTVASLVVSIACAVLLVRLWLLQPVPSDRSA